MSRPLASRLLAPRPGYKPPWFTVTQEGICVAGRSAGWASGRGTTPCRFRAGWLVTTRHGTYRLCGTHKNAALRDEKGVTAVPAPSQTDASRVRAHENVNADKHDGPG